MKPKPIPISKAKEIAGTGYDEIIIFGAHYETGIQHITTYGASQKACENAARGGNVIKQLLGWPPEKCNAKPARQRKREKLEKKITDKDKILNAMVDMITNPLGDDELNLAKFIGLATMAKNLVDEEADVTK